MTNNGEIIIKWIDVDDGHMANIYEARFTDWIGASRLLTAIRLSENLRRYKVTGDTKAFFEKYPHHEFTDLIE